MKYYIYQNVYAELENGDIVYSEEPVCSFSSHEEAEKWMHNNGSIKHEIKALNNETLEENENYLLFD